MSIRLKDTIYDLIDKSTKDGSGNIITSTYLKLSGGTISSSSYGPLTIKRSGSSNMAAIKFENDSGALGSIGMNTVSGNLMKYNSDTSSSYTILDSGNYSTWAAAKGHTHSYLPLSGGTLTGNLTLKVDSGDSPYLMFQRGDINHSSTFDWKIFCTGGNLVFQHDYGAWTTAFQLNYTDSSAMINGNTVLHAGNYTSYAATAGHTHNYAGSNSAGGPANLVVCSSATSDTNRPILVTNESNGLCYTTKVKLNYSTGTIFANHFAITGSGKTDTLLTTDNEHNIYFSIAGSVPFVINNSEKSVRPGISYNNQYSLGTSSSKWSNVYATTFNGNATSATKATQDGSGNVITSTYLKLTGGTLTGDLILNAGNEDRFLKFQYNNGDTYGWRIGYLGSGSGDANYLVIQTSQETAATWTNALRFGNTKGDALFSASVTASGGFIGALTGNVTGNVSGSSGSCTGNSASATKLATARTLWGQSFNGTANVSGNMTGVGSISMSSTLTLTGTTSANARINFSRGSSSDYPYNYITAPTGGIICMEPGGLDCSSATGYHFSNTAFYPAANNTYSLGTSSLKWSNVYATTFTGSLSGNATSSSSCSGNSATATLASTVTCPATNSNNDRPIVGTPGNNTLYHTTLATVNWSTGKIICGGLQSKDITLYSASGDSPHLIFQRGGLYDGTFDWDVYVTGGTLKFRINKSSATAASYTDILKMYNDDDTIRSTWTIYAPTFRNSSGTEVSYSGHTHSAYYDSTISRTANTVLAAPNGSAGTASFRKLVAADIPTLAISKISGLQSALDGKSATHSHPYAGSSTQGGAATLAVCSAATSDTNSPILVTKESNGLCYTTKAKLNYSTGIITCGGISTSGTLSFSGVGIIKTTTAQEIQLQYGSDSAKSLVLNSVSFKPFVSSTKKLKLGAYNSLWNGLYLPHSNTCLNNVGVNIMDDSGYIISSMGSDGSGIGLYAIGSIYLRGGCKKSTSTDTALTSSGTGIVIDASGNVTATTYKNTSGKEVSYSGHTHSYLPLSGGTLTGNLTLMAADPHNTDQYIKFKYSSTDLDSYSWRLGYLGTGSGDSNYFVLQSNGGGSWASAIRVGLTTRTVHMGAASGTAPISCDSTTVCTNLNAGLWDGYHLVVGSTGTNANTIYIVT